MYVSNSRTSTISAFSIDSATGALKPLTGSPLAAGTHPGTLAIDPMGQFIYTAGSSQPNDIQGLSTSISGFAIDSNSSALTPLSNAPLVNFPGAGVMAIVQVQ